MIFTHQKKILALSVLSACAGLTCPTSQAFTVNQVEAVKPHNKPVAYNKPSGPLFIASTSLNEMSRGGSASAPVLVNGHSHQDFGVNSASQIKFPGGIVINEQSSASLDNVLVTSSPDVNVALRVNNGSQATLTARSVIQAHYSDIDFGVNLDRGTLVAQGGVIDATDVGINETLKSTNRVTLTGTHVSADHFGIALSALDTVTLDDVTILSRGISTNPKLTYDGKFAAIHLDANELKTRRDGKFVINNSHVHGDGERGVGILITDESAGDSVVSATHSDILGGLYGIAVSRDNRFVNTPDDPHGLQNIQLSGVVVTGLTGEAISIEKGARADILVQDGTQLKGGNGIALDTGPETLTTLTTKNTAVAGDVINHGGNTHLTLDTTSRWQGRFQEVTSVDVKKTGEWQMTGASSVGNVSNSGTIALAHGTAAGNILTVRGNYTGNDGHLVFNTVLGGDNSLTDKILITGNAAGTTTVSVNKAGGTGAKTLDGIELIHVNGTSAEGAFTQKGRTVAGAYEYTLHKKANNWVLDSHMPTPDDNTGKVTDNTKGKVTDDTAVKVTGDDKGNHLADKTVMYRGDNIIRPEPGSYIANMAATSMFLTRLHERAGENRYMNQPGEGSAITSLWLRQVGRHSQFRDNSGQLRTTGNTYVAQLGGDLAQWSSNDHDRWHMGVMAGYGNNHNTTRSTVTGYRSAGSVDGYSAGIYGTWYQNDTDSTGAYVDGQLMYNWFNNSVKGDRISVENYASRGFAASVESGYTFALGESGPASNLTRYFVEPQLQVTWNGIRADSLVEANGTHQESQSNDNIQTRLGGRAFLQGHNHLDAGKDRSFEPFIELNWLHNTGRYGSTLNGVTIEQAGATNLAEVKLGIEGKLSKSMQLWGDVGHQVGGEGYSNSTAMLGIKYAF